VQELYAKAAVIDFERLRGHQDCCELVDCEESLKAAFHTDVRPSLKAWRKSKGLPEEPLAAFRDSGYLEQITRERGGKNRESGSSYA